MVAAVLDCCRRLPGGAGVVWDCGSPLANRQSEKEIPPQVNIEADRRMNVVVGSAIGLTVVLLFVMLTASVRTGHAIANLTSKNPVTIDVIGHQWWWEVRYEAHKLTKQ